MRRALDFRSALPILPQARMNISITFQESHAQVCALIADFREREAFYLSAEYQEAEARQDFIDKFWIALGWDVRHDRQKNPYEQEVKVERGVSVVTGLAQKKADYAFFLGPDYRIPRFFCEAKKPSVKIREDRDAHFQTHRYGYSAKTKLSVLFDFEELVIVDCRRKPNVDFALTAAHRSYCYGDFEDEAKFGEIYWLFSREAVGDGKLDAYVAAMPKVKKTGKQAGAQRGSDSQTVDDSFLDDLERYRSELARMLKNRNAELDGDTLTELVQRILDRLVFLRFLEDKLIETEHSVHEFTKTAEGQGWARFLTVSRKLDARYNGVVFKEHPLLDGGTLTVDDGDFLAICKELSHERTPYDFNAIPVHILGSIYERFLGTVITTTDKRAKPELKPEVRKAGGVYYTPEYIVRYICEQTVGKLIEGKTPVQIEKMRFADIACGSGSFLLGIFDLLLRYHGRWYAAHTEAAGKENLAPAAKNRKRKKEFIPAVVEREGLLCLTLEKKRQILVNNIFGVDLDPQAVEVAQLSLYLKLLEDETTASTRDDYLAFHEALLPPLGGNIKRGNSLIGTDIERGKFEFSTTEERKLRPMDFEDAFSLGRFGKFDAIVGNPPYVFTRETITPLERQYYACRYKLGWEKQNTYMLFMERGMELIREGGCLSFIVPNSWLTMESAKLLRAHMLKHLSWVLDLNYAVFDDVAMEPSIFGALGVERTDPVLVTRISRPEQLVECQYSSAKRADLIHHNRILFRSTSKSAELVERMLESGIPLGTAFDVRTGLQAYEKGRGIPPQSADDVKNHVFDRPERVDAHSIRYLEGRDVRRYSIEWSGLWMQYGPWLSQPREIGIFTRPRLLLREITGALPYALNFTFTDEQFLNNKSVLNILDYSDGIDRLKTVLGILNSSLLSYFYKQHAVKSGRTIFPKVVAKDLAIFPVAADISAQASAEIAQRVEQLMQHHRSLATAKTESDRTYLEDKCAGLDRQIDQLTYELYDLTPEEVALVEQGK